MELITLATFAFLLTVKHTVCDLALQRLFPADKSFYFNKAAHTHYFHHGLGSFFIGLMFSPYFAVAIGLLDYLIHWHVDHWKTLVRNHYGWKQEQDQFWILQTCDQILHFLTYYLFVLLAIYTYA
tara:strand:- start:423 stop:797 length:375 start_codon:yes stop_codon:yes gene_type:complete